MVHWAYGHDRPMDRMYIDLSEEPMLMAKQGFIPVVYWLEPLMKMTLVSFYEVHSIVKSQFENLGYGHDIYMLCCR